MCGIKVWLIKHPTYTKLLVTRIIYNKIKLRYKKTRKFLFFLKYLILHFYIQKSKKYKVLLITFFNYLKINKKLFYRVKGRYNNERIKLSLNLLNTIFLRKKNLQMVALIMYKFFYIKKLL